jgi:selenide,water dikinase
MASSVDVVLPMIDDPALFGRIATAHVLNDLYAVGASPGFGLNILGLPKEAPDTLVDKQVSEMMAASEEALEAEGATLCGGHTLESDFLFFGLSASGIVPAERTVGLDQAEVGDQLILTKPLGTSVATKAWKMTDLRPDAFPDVLAGLLGSNGPASRAILTCEHAGCTDISGFGFFGHLHNLVTASGVAASIETRRLPVYASTREYATHDSGTRLYSANAEFAAQSVHGLTDLDPIDRMIFCDSQISGGLLISVAKTDLENLISQIESEGGECHMIGRVVAGDAGNVVLN